MNAPGERPTTRVRRPKKEEIRARLLRAATEVFSAKGLEKATLEEIAETAGFSKGAVYSNFEGKDDLFIALVERQLDERLKKIETIFSREGDTLEKIRESGKLLNDFSLIDPEWQMLFIEYWLRAARNPKLKERFLARRIKMREKISRLVEEYAGGNEDAYPLSFSQYAVTILALSNGLGIEQIIDPEAGQENLLMRLLALVFQKSPAANEKRTASR